MPRARIALFVLEALPNARAMRRFVADYAREIAFVGLSNAERPAAGGLVGQVRQHLARSGPAILPYLAINFGLPDLMRSLSPLTQALARTRDLSETTPLAALCARHGVPALSVDDVNGPEVADALRSHAPDLIVTYHFDQILKPETIAAARLGGINAHPGLLPRHRGPVPTIHALAEGPDNFGMTLHRLAPRIDAGAILAQESFRLTPGITATRASVHLHQHGLLMLQSLLDRIAQADAIPEGRIAETLPYCGFPDAAMLRAMRARGGKLTDIRDLADALALNTLG
ncbi:formyltransferase family protein [Methylobacterium dankookense]|uniref:Methionyl-tRNA formyltransferase n=1 Tax=Methylobacterium dankookense TaxID=560405 RepID=A0A564G7K4_9HYPH|nr:formyltransferase family protein [Methylobacterium dankookense]GJD59654.1 Methionyl-tRNA formyltransferase [Methylobacterium dankookense]VUF16006.1 Methionyl-tRNA formyltransferase [Methylobacterium dankookense]